MLKKFLISAIALTLCTGAAKKPPEKFTAIVRKVIDGDTIAVYREPLATYQKIRLVCIDAPEKSQTPHGLASKDWLSKQVLGKTVRIESFGIDQYQRILGKVFIENDSINLMSIQEGHSVAYRAYMRPCQEEKDFYFNSEAEAKRNKLGFWNQEAAIMPWDWRKRR